MIVQFRNYLIDLDEVQLIGELRPYDKSGIFWSFPIYLHGKPESIKIEFAIYHFSEEVHRQLLWDNTKMTEKENYELRKEKFTEKYETLKTLWVEYKKEKYFKIL